MNTFWMFFKFMPVVIFIGAPITIFITYGIAIAKDHVNPVWPYVSDTGTKPPESCIFTLCFSTSAFLIVCTSYIRYLEVSELVKLKPSIKIKPVCNKCAFGLAIFSALGLNVVASFQELNEFTTHLVGAMVCFFCGTAYFFFQTIFTRRMYPEAKALFWIRMILTILNVLGLIGTFGPVHCALEQFKGDDILKWSEKDGGYMFHLISTFSEWAMIASFVSYMFTIFWDFKKYDMEAPVIKFKDIETVERKNEANVRPDAPKQRQDPEA